MTQPPSRRPRPASRSEDDWVPPPWNQPPEREAPRPDTRRATTDYPPIPEPVRPPTRSLSAHESGFVLGMAIAPALVGLLAIFVSFVPLLAGSGSVPQGLILVVFFQFGITTLLRASDSHPLMQSWISTLICTAVLAPLLALQVTLLREPYVSVSRDSAAPSMVATLIVSMVLIVGAVWSVASSWESPDEAGLLFMMQGMMVPALIGMRSTIGQDPALRMMGQVMLLAAAATALAWILPVSTRLLVPAGAVAVEFVFLWATGHGPWFHVTSGDIVRVLYSVILAVSVILVVAVPFTALWVNQGAKRASQNQTDHVRTSNPPGPTGHTRVRSGPALRR